MNVLIENGVFDAVAEHLKKNLAKGEGVLELNCGKGDFAEFVHGKYGLTNYHGIDDDADDIKEAKKRVPKFKSRFHTKEGKYKRDIVVCLHGTPFETIPTGQRLIALTSGFDDYDSVCMAIGGLYAEGARTIQHGDMFITYGVRA